MKKKKIYIIITIVSLSGLLFFPLPEPECADNGDFCEYSPSITADGNTLIYQADYHHKNDFKIYCRTRKEEKPDGVIEWTEAVMLENVNSPGLDGGCFITYDQRHLIITSNRPGGQGSADLWISTRQGNTWSRPVNMGWPVNSPGYEGFASLSPDGKTLYFVRRCPEKKNCRDRAYGLYYAEKKNGLWTEPKKMPAPVNSAYCEIGPVILADGVTLLFSSTRPGGFGGYDLYKSVKRGDGAWSEALNLGASVNTDREESLAAIPASGRIMFYTQSLHRDSAISRIKTVRFSKETSPFMPVTVSGTVKNKGEKGTPLQARITVLDPYQYEEPVITESDARDGTFSITLNKGKKYTMTVAREGYIPGSTDVDLTDTAKTGNITIKNTIALEPIRKGAGFILDNIEFEYNSHVLLESSKPGLMRLSELMRSNPAIKIEISGHTDDVGSTGFNNDLSARRARSVRDYLVRQEIDAGRMITKGYGKARPLKSNATEEGRKANRRVEIKIITVP